MKVFLIFLISLQFITTPFAAEINYESEVRIVLERLRSDGPVSVLKELKGSLYDSEFADAVTLLKRTGSVRPEFRESSPGIWEWEQDGNKILFSINDLKKGEMWINRKLFKYKHVAFHELQDALHPYEKLSEGPFTRAEGVVIAVLIGHLSLDKKMK
ncbi:hypothetical protein [Peredibacter starrii]|uniref:Uncharacterized protein n=1 Tax=Peredibacter starrii TaxID=28202 RepID=A0AAX4HR36_9BACT|nr:hypothetical protein [Peredibacter starrii]WPU65759.1 hypothetical protein SOO65_03270 [Peredibacter starrii]